MPWHKKNWREPVLGDYPDSFGIQMQLCVSFCDLGHVTDMQSNLAVLDGLGPLQDQMPYIGRHILKVAVIPSRFPIFTQGFFEAPRVIDGARTD